MHREPSASQRGWVGLIVVLLALVIVAVLAQGALTSYGLVSGAPPAAKAGTPAHATETGHVEVPGPGSPPAAALERAHGVADMLKREVDERARDDGSAK